jgi:hypothetical protein
LFDRITRAGGVALLVSNDPSVPPKQNPGAGVRQIAFAFPPEEPSGTGAAYGCMFSESMVNTEVVAEAFEFAWEIAVTVKLAGSVLAALVTVGTVFGARYWPVADIVPQTETGKALQLSCQLTAVLLVPVTVAENCTLWKVLIFVTSVVMVTLTAGGVLPPPPPPHTVNPKVPATANMPAKRARLLMSFSLRSKSGNGYWCFSLCVFIGYRGTRRDRTGKLVPLLCANPSREILMRK